LLLLSSSSSSSVFVFLRGARFSINSAFLLSKFCSEYYSESIGLGQNCTYYITVVRYCFRHCSAVCFCRLLVTTRGSKTRLSTTKSIVITVTDIAAGSAAVAAAAAAAATALYRCTGLCFCWRWWRWLWRCWYDPSVVSAAISAPRVCRRATLARRHIRQSYTAANTATVYPQTSNHTGSPWDWGGLCTARRQQTAVATLDKNYQIHCYCQRLKNIKSWGRHCWISVMK